MKRIVKRSAWFSWAFFSGLFLITLFLSYQIHRDRGFFNWKSELWADRAGYYIYLPGALFYGFDAAKVPDQMAEKSGYGFWINAANGRIETKYPCGVAILLSPFFMATHLVSMALSIPEEGGFSPLYHRMTDLAAVVYMILGLLLLRQVLKQYFSPLVQYLTLFFVFAGTNLFYYTVDDGSMSHVYSFFLFSLYLFALVRYLDNRQYRFFLLLVFAGSLAVVTRPTNILIFALFFVWDLSSFPDFRKRIRDFFKPLHLISFLVVLFLVLLPQLLYWNFLHGRWIAYSYGDEGFINWHQPYMAEVWFAPLNGLIPYVPMVLLMLAGMGLMISRKQFNGWVSLALFLIVSYICASWQTWYFGCSFGQRSYVEYFAIFAIPLGFLLQWASDSRWMLNKLWVLLLLVLFSWFTIRMTYAWEKCFFGATWDWNSYHRQLERAGIPLPGKATMNFQNDYENQALNEGNVISRESVRSGMHSATFDEKQEYCCRALRFMWDFPQEHMPLTVNASCWVLFPDSVHRGPKLVFSVERNGESVQWEGKEIAELVPVTGTWTRISASFSIPENLPGDAQLLLYIWNPRKLPLFVDDMTVSYDQAQ